MTGSMAAQAEIDYVEPYLDDINGRTGRHVYSLSVMAPSYGYILPLGEYNATELNTTALQSCMDCSLSNSQAEDKRAFGYCDDNSDEQGGGGGKSAVIQEYLYRMIAAEEKPVREIWLISPQRMISGMSFVGQWESAQSNELRGNDYQ